MSTHHAQLWDTQVECGRRADSGRDSYNDHADGQDDHGGHDHDSIRGADRGQPTPAHGDGGGVYENRQRAGTLWQPNPKPSPKLVGSYGAASILTWPIVDILSIKIREI